MDVSLSSAILLSLAAAAGAVLIDLVPAVWVARLLARPHLRGRALLSAVVHLPVVLPPVVTGYLLLLLFARDGALGGALHEAGIVVPFRFLGCVVAAAVVAFPFLVTSLRAALEAADPRLEGLAQTLGDTPFRAFLRVTLPLAAPGLGAGIVLAFARALGEFGATIVLAGNTPGETQTLALAVFDLLSGRGTEEEAAVLTGASVGPAAAPRVRPEWLLHRHRRRRAC